MSEIVIRKMENKDLARVMEIFSYAREFMRRTDNPNQWGNDWPAESATLEDIKNGTGYVVEDEGHVFATFAFILGEDPTYLEVDKFDVYEKYIFNDSQDGEEERIINNENPILYDSQDGEEERIINNENPILYDSQDDKEERIINNEKTIFDGVRDGKEVNEIDNEKNKCGNARESKELISKSNESESKINNLISDIKKLCLQEGKWLNDEPYGTIHRLAGDGTHEGVFETCLEYCEKHVDNVRADTHIDNQILQHKLIKNGFIPCGVIYVRDHMPRLAFHKIVNGKQKIEEEEKYDFHGLGVVLEPKIVRVDNDAVLDKLFSNFDLIQNITTEIRMNDDADKLSAGNSINAKIEHDERKTANQLGKATRNLSRKQLKKLRKKAAMEESEHIRNIYEKKYGKPLKITQKSLAVEIYGHYYILKKSDAFEAKFGSNKLTRWLKRHMDVIDCGEKDVDNNRFVWDFLEKFW